MDYLLMRKNESITNLFISENGIMQGYSKKFKNKELAPLMYRKEDDWIERWWR